MVTNNGEITYYFSEAEKRGISRASFNRARDMLIEKGFLDVHHTGQGRRSKDATLYGLSDRWRNWGTPKFIEVTRQKDTRKGVGFALHWARKKAGISSDTPTRIAGDTSMSVRSAAGDTPKKRQNRAKR